MLWSFSFSFQAFKILMSLSDFEFLNLISFKCFLQKHRECFYQFQHYTLELNPISLPAWLSVFLTLCLFMFLSLIISVSLYILALFQINQEWQRHVGVIWTPGNFSLSFPLSILPCFYVSFCLYLSVTMFHSVSISPLYLLCFRSIKNDRDTSEFSKLLDLLHYTSQISFSSGTVTGRVKFSISTISQISDLLQSRYSYFANQV